MPSFFSHCITYYIIHPVFYLQPIDESMLPDGRVGKSRGGTGIGATMYDEFWKAYREVLLPSSAADERRKDDTVYTSAAHSIPKLVKLATDALKRKLDDNEFETMPPVPSDDWVRSQCVPNVSTNKASAKFTGALEAQRAVQTRKLRKEHMDQHWVNNITKYYMEWIVEIHNKHEGVVEFFGQDDKEMIPCGDAIPISTGVRANNKGILSIKDKKGLKAMDYDFHYANTIPSVTLRCNLPSDISGSLFIGDEDGIGKIFVTLRDAMFDPS